jgi:hypothetical protein
MGSMVYAGTSVSKNWAMFTPPTVTDQQLYNYLYFIYSHFNQAQIVTTDPDGSVRDQAGKFLIYNNAGTHQLCFQTAQPSGTTWKCANLS